MHQNLDIWTGDPLKFKIDHPLLFVSVFLVNSIRMKRVDCSEIILAVTVRKKARMESIQSNTTPDPGHRMGKCQKHKKTSNTRELRGQHFPKR